MLLGKSNLCMLAPNVKQNYLAMRSVILWVSVFKKSYLGNKSFFIWDFRFIFTWLETIFWQNLASHSPKEIWVSQNWAFGQRTNSSLPHFVFSSFVKLNFIFSVRHLWDLLLKVCFGSKFKTCIFSLLLAVHCTIDSIKHKVEITF